jgi:predicted nucleic acid-binding protein
VILVDTSVWVAHFKRRSAHLVELLTTARVLCHPQVVVEVACGTPPSRAEVIGLLSALPQTSARLGGVPQTPVATHAELLALVERRGLAGRGCGYVDLNLLASVLLSPAARLWTLDRRLAAIAADWGRAHAAEV